MSEGIAITTSFATQSVSVCTLVRGRRRHLAALVDALAGQFRRPDELVIAVMEERESSAGFDVGGRLGFPFRCIHVPGDKLPLARARNEAAAMATGDVLVFMDVDCIPGPDLVASYTTALDRCGGCVMGPVRYLGPGEADGFEFDRCWRTAVPHPARLDPADTAEPYVHMEDYGEFWSLSFAIRRDDFFRAGGLDERFVGYGGEDTDFGLALHGAGLPLVWCAAARALHQWHPVHVPPLQHFSDIVANARRFYAKHGFWPMQYWIEQFEASGYLRRGRDLKVLRVPSAEEVQASRQPLDVRFS